MMSDSNSSVSTGQSSMYAARSTRQAFDRWLNSGHMTSDESLACRVQICGACYDSCPRSDRGGPRKFCPIRPPILERYTAGRRPTTPSLLKASLAYSTVNPWFLRFLFAVEPIASSELRPVTWESCFAHFRSTRAGVDLQRPATYEPLQIKDRSAFRFDGKASDGKSPYDPAQRRRVFL